MPPEDHCRSMKAFTLLCILSHVYSGDPLQNLLRDVILSVRSASERIISALPISTSQDLMYQMDPKTSQAIGSLTDFVNVCPPSIALPNMDGFWQITHISKQFLLGVFTEVEQLIDRVSLGGPTYVPKTIGDILRTGELPHCMALSVLADPFPIPFEYSFGSIMGRKSIIGQLATEDGRHLSLNFGGDVELRSSLIYSSPSDDILVLADLDALPKCSNILVLRRNQSFEGRLPLQLASQGSSPPSNPLIPVPCP